MKNWEAATLEIVDLKNTEFGPYNPENPDSEKTQLVKPNGDVGYVQEFGDNVNRLS